MLLAKLSSARSHAGGETQPSAVPCSWRATGQDRSRFGATAGEGRSFSRGAGRSNGSLYGDRTRVAKCQGQRHRLKILER